MSVIEKTVCCCVMAAIKGKCILSKVIIKHLGLLPTHIAGLFLQPCPSDLLFIILDRMTLLQIII
jgi:hypothetical protein